MKLLADVQFIVYGKPTAKPAHRSYRDKSGNIRTYQVRDLTWEALLINAYREAAGKQGLFGPMEPDVPVEMNILAYFPVPMSRPKWWKQRATNEDLPPLPYLSRPDRDNITKRVQDRLKGVAYCRDEQIFGGETSKWYGARPRTEVQLVFFEPLKRADVEQRSTMFRSVVIESPATGLPVRRTQTG